MLKVEQIFLGTFRKFAKDECGASAIEYALIAALIGVAIIGGLKAFGDSQVGAWGGLSNKVDTTLKSN